MANQTQRTPPTSRWSFPVARFFGIQVRIHATFFLLLVWVGFGQWATGNSALAALRALLVTITVFTIIVVHEFSHALTARHFGVHTQDITLYPIGGISRMDRIPDDPRQELLIALAGPLVNVVFALLLWAWVVVSGDTLRFAVPGAPEAPLGLQFFWINVILAGFNLLPAFPMDGGRVLRALLSLKFPRVKATSWAAAVGQAFALLLATFGLFFNPWLILIAVFLWIGAQGELNALQIMSTLQRFTTREAMITHVETLDPLETLANVSDRVLRGFQQDFPVVEEGRVVGLLTFRDLLFGLSRSGANARVQAFMHREFESADPDEPLNKILERVQKEEPKTIVVQRQGRLFGVVDTTNIRELLRIESALVTHA